MRSGYAIAAVMILALLHGITTALVRPMFQVSDELAYFAGVQDGAVRLVAREPGDPQRPRVLYRDRFVYDTPAGKPLFRYAGATAFIAIGGVVPLPTSAVVLRLFFALSLPVAVLATWLLARHLAPHNGTVLLCAPLLVALHPVYVKYASGVTPDAWGNAAAMFAVWLAVRLADGTARRIELGATVLVSAIAIALKDTTFFLAALVPLALLLRLHVRGKTRGEDFLATIRSDPWLLALPAGLAVAFAVLLFAPTASALSSPYYHKIQDGTVSISRIPALSAAAMVTVWEQLPGLFDSFWGNLGNFGATVVLMPEAVMRVILGGTLLAAVALVIATWSRPRSGDEAVKSYARLMLLLIGGALLCLQPAVRQALLGTDDLFQGRWLFPMMSVVAVTLTMGWSTLWPQPERLSLLIGWLLATYAVVAMFTVVIPYYYVQFPETYRLSGVFLQGTAGRGADPAWVLEHVTRPSLLRSNAVMLGLFGLWLAWLAVCLVCLPRWAALAPTRQP